MNIASARSIALTGLDFQRRRLESSASNVANATTDDYQATRIEGAAEENGGVSARTALTGDPAPVIMDPDVGERTLSNTNIATERVTQINAVNAFTANMAVLKTADEMEESILDIKG